MAPEGERRDNVTRPESLQETKEVHFAGTTEVKFRAGGSAKGYIRSQSLSLTSSNPDKATLTSRSTKVSRAFSVSVSGAGDLPSLHLGSLENTGST